MKCIHCGGLLEEDEKFCSYCGSEIEAEEENKEETFIKETNEINSKNKTSNPFCVASIVLGIISIIGAISFIFGLMGLISGIVGLILGIIGNKKDKNVAGIVLTSIGTFLSLVVVIIFIIIVKFFINVANISDSNGFIYDYDIIEKY